MTVEFEDLEPAFVGYSGRVSKQFSRKSRVAKEGAAQLLPVPRRRDYEPENRKSHWSCIQRDLNWVQGRDLNPRPSGYEPVVQVVFKGLKGSSCNTSCNRCLYIPVKCL
jgi:hypothetical protein